MPEELPKLNGHKILIVEDDPLLIRMYMTKFKSEGFEVFTAPDGQAGYDMAIAQKPTAIVLDVMMPRLSGIDMLTKLRQTPEFQNTIVIMLSNLAKEEEKQKALALGAKEYLQKSGITPGEIVAKINKYL